MSDEEVRVMVELFYQSNEEGYVHVFFKDLAKMTGKTVKKCVDIVDDLISKEVVELIARKGNLPAELRINMCGRVKDTRKEQVFKFKVE